MKIDKSKVEMIMARACLGQNEAAKKMGTNQANLAHLIGNERNHRPESVGKLAKALGVDPTEILKGGDE